MSASKVDMVKLGELIELCDERNSNGVYGEKDVRGISTDKKFIETKANLDSVSLNSYKVVQPREFVYVADTSRRGDKIALALNDSNSAYLISAIYTTFRCIDVGVLLPEYLFLLLNRTEFDRYSRFHSWGSARETFDWSELCDTLIPLPDIEVQRELVGVYEGLKRLAEENEAMLDPLAHACEAFIKECTFPACKDNSTQDACSPCSGTLEAYPPCRLGDYIEECDERNSSGKYTINDVRGISIEKKLINTKADMAGVSLTPYKVMHPHEFCYVTVTSRNGGKISLAMNDTDSTYIVSSSYITFRCKDTKVLLPEYLFLLLSRREFDRYARFNSWGSARETFDWAEMCRVEIPLPPIEVQEKIVALYRCYEECKRIATEAREQLKTICPALVQRGKQA